MVSLRSLFLIVIESSQVLFSNIYSNCQIHNCTWALPTTHSLMDKHNGSTNVWRLFFVALYDPTPSNGVNGYHWLSIGITHLTTQLWEGHHLRFCMGINRGILEFQVLMLVILLRWRNGCLEDSCSIRWFINSLLERARGWNTKQINTDLRGKLQLVMLFTWNYNRMFRHQ